MKLEEDPVSGGKSPRMTLKGTDYVSAQYLYMGWQALSFHSFVPNHHLHFLTPFRPSAANY